MNQDVLKYLLPFLENESLAFFAFDYSPPIDLYLPKEEKVEQMYYNSTFVLCNERFAGLYNTTKADLIGCKYADVVPFSDEVKGFLGAFVDSNFNFQNQQITEIDEHGVDRHFLNHAWGNIIDDKIHGVFGTNIDITNQVQREKKFQEEERKLSKILSVLPVGIYQNDAEGNLIYGNSMAEQIVGHALEDSTGDEWVKQMHPEDRDRIFEAFHQAIANKTRFSEEYRFIRKDGKTVHVLSEAEPIYGAEDTFQGMIGFLSDISQRIEYEHKLQQSIIERELLLAEIHHRVKNNLAIISGLIDLQRYSIDDEILDYNLLNTQSRIMSIASVHKLLYESKNFTDISIIKLVKKLCHEIHNTYHSDLLHVEFDIQSDDIFLNANQAVPFGLVLNELITNSYKHGFAGQEKATITIRFKLEDGIIKFRYSDSGSGFEGDFNQDSLPQTSLGFLLIYNLSVQLSAINFRIYADEGFRFNMDFQLVNNSLKGSTINRAFKSELKELFKR